MARLLSAQILSYQGTNNIIILNRNSTNCFGFGSCFLNDEDLGPALGYILVNTSLSFEEICFKKKWAFKPTKRSVAEPERESPGPELFRLKPETNFFIGFGYHFLKQKNVYLYTNVSKNSWQFEV